MNKTVLYVSGFSANLRARDLAYEFERYGRLIRCDIPALKSASSSPFAFVEFRREADAEDAYYDMHGRSIDGRRIAVQWAKRPPSSAWRHDGSGGDRRDAPRDSGRDRDYDRDRRRSPPRRRSPSPRRDDRDQDRDHGRRRSVSPRRDEKERDRQEARSVSPIREKETNGNGDREAKYGEDMDEDRERRND
ncbi:hypothetical protein IAR55_005800 [Kwoniella newhampshirensis]|uniref:RRM domain-containing protein n=1 Tax=Kwoniella newhampshirensis TaxID=1651941 RepID=A0AAW0YVH1_9TREE